MNPICESINESCTECNVGHTNIPYSSSEDDECYCKYSNIDIDELSDSNLNDHHQPIHHRVRSNGSSYNCYSSGESLVSDFESDGIVTFLDKSNTKAEARLIARRQARVEAREIRMREIERQQKKTEENADKTFDMLVADGSNINRINKNSKGTSAHKTSSSTVNANSYQSNRRNSFDSLDESNPNYRDFRMELKVLEEKFKIAMVQNAQLDNDKAAVHYMIDMYKDRNTDIEEELIHIKREHKELCRENENLKRLLTAQKLEFIELRKELEERDQLIEDKGLVIIASDKDVLNNDQNNTKIKRVLVSTENAQFLNDEKDMQLKNIIKERNSYLDEINQLKLELHEAKRLIDNQYNNSNYDNLGDNSQRETCKILADYKFKLQRADQDISTLHANLARLESQVIRYKTAFEVAEKSEDEIKLEKRKLQRELRESQSKIEELETSNMHLLKRFDKLKNAKSSLLKDL